ncbi:MAG TPA: nucleoside-diphosphate sugar epimerase/dehydratase [Ensifer sp.]|nr:nucleoside-diphosphate sugar epimerase/dehydratase [Ensifer sp.]
MALKALDQIAVPMLALPRPAKRLVAVSVDVGICVLTVWLAFYLRLGEFTALTGNALWAVAAAALLSIPLFIITGLYRAIFRYSGWPALLAVARAVTAYGIIYAAIFTGVGIPGVPRTVGLIQPILLLLFVGGSRALAHVWLGGRYESILRRAARPKALIYGANQAGHELALALANSPQMNVVGFLDEDRSLHKRSLNGLPVYDPADLGSLLETRKIAHVLLAMPHASRRRRNEILEQLRIHQVSVRTLPSLTDLAQGRVTVSDLRELDIDDLLGREQVSPNVELLEKNILNKVVLVTGAGGSIGSELCRQISSIGPRKLLLLEQNEFALYAIHQELEQKFSERGAQILPLLASVTDTRRVQQIIQTWQPDTVYHAAAYKHVPLVEHNPVEGIRNNVFGTLHVARAAAAAEVADFVLVSTDKAVRPTNIMGASKRIAEMVLQAMANDSATTKFSMVRFGNVLGSSGSVVPKFKQQIQEGGPITLTHPEITRYFMTIPEASQLVIQAGAMSSGGDVFVLDMGEPVRIIDLARRLIDLSGLTVRDTETPEGEIEIKITGLRPGEKLYEELLIGDNPEATPHPRIMKAHEHFLPWAVLLPKLEQIEKLLDDNDVAAIRSAVKELVPGYAGEGKIVDWVHLEECSGSGEC